MDASYIFDSNTISLYNMLNNQPLDRPTGATASIIQSMNQDQKNQYNLWLALPESQRDDIDELIYEQQGPVIIELNTYANVRRITLEQLADLLANGQIVSYKNIDDRHMRFTDNNGQNYLVQGKYDQQTNRILPL